MPVLHGSLTPEGEAAVPRHPGGVVFGQVEGAMYKTRGFPSLAGWFIAVALSSCSHGPGKAAKPDVAVRPPGGGLTVEVRPGSGLYAVRGRRGLV